jgi:predicted MPP superfamily phosphohydrolase
VIKGFSSRIASAIPPPCLTALRVGSDALFGERHRLERFEVELSTDLGAAAPAEVRLALLADFHFDPLCEVEFMARCVDTANELEPDLVLLLGDFASHDPSRLPVLAEILGGLRTRFGVYVIFGNHDHIAGIDAVVEALAPLPFTLMRNQIARIRFPDGELAVVGFDSATYVRPDFSLLDRLHPGERALVLCHEPDVFVHTAMHPNAALQLSGHTHGGQFFPWNLVVRGIYLHPGGLGKIKELQVYVSHGTGFWGPPIRLGTDGEITTLEMIRMSS